jgi:hypothetical protein
MIDPKILNALRDPKVEFFFIPSPTLRQIVAEGRHPISEFLSPQEKADILSGHGISMDTQLVIDYLEKRANKQLQFILSNSEIRVFGAEELLLKTEEQRK